jgi:hypothetical protein
MFGIKESVDFFGRTVSLGFLFELVDDPDDDTPFRAYTKPSTSGPTPAPPSSPITCTRWQTSAVWATAFATLPRRLRRNSAVDLSQPLGKTGFFMS